MIYDLFQEVRNPGILGSKTPDFEVFRELHSSQDPRNARNMQCIAWRAREGAVWPLVPARPVNIYII